MPVDRSLLPELPGKPEWYVENAPQAVDRRPQGDEYPVPTAPGMPAQAEPAFHAPVPSLEAPQFPTVGTQPGSGRGKSKVKALAGRLKH